MAYEKFGQARHRPPGEWVQTSHLTEVVGITFRKTSASAFFKAVKACERKSGEYGLLLEQQPDNPHDPNAIAVIGVATVYPWFQTPRKAEFPLGYVPKELSASVKRDLLDKGLPLSIELLSLFRREDYHEVKFVLLGPPGYSVGKRESASMGAPNAGASDSEKEASLLAWIESTEAEDAERKWGVAPRPYLDLAKLYRRLKRADAEILVLERYAAQRKAPGVVPKVLAERLEKARARVSKL